MAGTSVQTLDISPVGRVEGDLDVGVEIEHGHVINAWTERDGRGWGATKNYQLVSPTTWNAGPRSRDRARGPIEQALIGTLIADPRDPVEVGHVCRSDDSCLVCTVHACDAKTGAQLAKLRTA